MDKEQIFVYICEGRHNYTTLIGYNETLESLSIYFDGEENIPQDIKIFKLVPSAKLKISLEKI